jgi:pimeloyl-ACP methyl ester carboxylesterase
MSTWFSGDITAVGIDGAPGIKVHYHRTGGDKPPLVLAHGFSDNGLCWTRVAQVLEKEYDVIMPDARGHGLSDAPEEGYSSEDMAADLAGLIRALKLDRPALMGHSMGASTVAATVVGYPELLTCAILEDPPWFDENSPWNRGRAELSEEERKAQADKRLAEIVATKSKPKAEIIAGGRERSPTWDKVEWSPWADAKKQMSTNILGRMTIARKPWQEIAGALTRPTLLVTADPDSAIVTPKIAAQAQAMNDCIQWVRIEGAGHNIRREQFETFVEAVTDFLSRHYR